MATRSVKVRVHDGHLEPLEAVQLVEGEELLITVPVPEAQRQQRATVASFLVRDLGLGMRQLTREDAYDDGG